MKIPKNNLTNNSWSIVIAAQQKLAPSEFRALLADPRSSEAFIRLIGCELEKRGQCYDHRGRESWVRSMIYQIKENFILYPLPDDGYSGPRLEPEPETNTHMDYSKIAVANVTLVYGENVALLDAPACMRMVRAINAEIEDLQKVNAIAENDFVTKQIAERGAALAKIVERLNELAA